MSTYDKSFSNFLDLSSPMTYAKIQTYGVLGSGEEDF